MQHAATAGAVVLAAAAIGAGLYGQHAAAVVFGIGVLVLTEAALRANRRHRREIAEHDWGRRRGVGERPQPLWPCCLLAQSTHNRTHSPRCNRDLTPEQFWEIVAHLDGP